MFDIVILSTLLCLPVGCNLLRTCHITENMTDSENTLTKFRPTSWRLKGEEDTRWAMSNMISATHKVHAWDEVWLIKSCMEINFYQDMKKGRVRDSQEEMEISVHVPWSRRELPLFIPDIHWLPKKLHKLKEASEWDKDRKVSRKQEAMLLDTKSYNRFVNYRTFSWQRLNISNVYNIFVISDYSKIMIIKPTHPSSMLSTRTHSTD